MSLQLGNVDQTLQAVATNIVVAPANASLTILKATITNADATNAHKVTVYRVPSGGAADVGDVMVDGFAIAPGDTAVLPLSGHSLINGQPLAAMAEVAAEVNISISWAQTV